VSTPPPYGPDSSPTPGRRREEAAASSPETARWSEDHTRPLGAGGDGEPTGVVPARHLAPEQPTIAVPTTGDWERTSAEPPPGGYWQGGEADRSRGADQVPSTAEPSIFPEGVYAEPPSRAGAHLWAVLISLVLSPVAWFLINDGSARIYWSLRSDQGDVNIAGLAGLAAGLLVALIVLLAARWSSIGAAIAGVIAFLVGVAFLVLPNRAFTVLESWETPLRRFGGFGENLYAYLVESAQRGQFVIAGFLLFLVGVVSHGARRKGRREEYARLAVRAARGSNPFA
jgi:hypothetical protein